MADTRLYTLLAATAVTAVAATVALAPTFQPSREPAPVPVSNALGSTATNPDTDLDTFDTTLTIGTGRAFPGNYRVTNKRNTCKVRHTTAAGQSRTFTVTPQVAKVYIQAAPKDKLEMARCNYETVATDRVSGDDEPGNGTLLVGADIAAGTYVFKRNPRCYATIAEKALFTASFTHIIYGAPKTVEVANGNLIRSKECSWRSATPKEAAAHQAQVAAREAAAKAAAEAIANSGKDNKTSATGTTTISATTVKPKRTTTKKSNTNSGSIRPTKKKTTTKKYTKKSSRSHSN